MKCRVLTFSVFIIAGLPLFAQRPTENYQGRQAAANQVLVKLNSVDAPGLAAIQKLADADDIRQVGGPNGPHVVHSRSLNITALMAVLKSRPEAGYVEPDYIVSVKATPNDTSFSNQWALLNSSKPGADIGATSAWDVSTGGAANVIGVVDTGVDYTHPDLAANMWSAPAAFTVNLSWGSLTCPAGTHGYNAVAHTCTPMDDNDHGTHVSGTIGAAGNNANGVAGVNWTTRIMALKFMDSTGSGTISNAIDCIEFAIQAKAVFAGSNGANVRVLSNSWTGSGYMQSLLDEINKAGTSEILFVAAAGNNATNIDVSPTYPAAYTASNLITVAATDSTDAMASFSNYGSLHVHLGAPGVSILSTVPNNSYAYYSGTSMATPHVAGAAMLVLSKCSITTTNLKSLLLSNVDADAALIGYTTTGGRLNVNRAIRSCATVPISPASTASFVKTDTTTQGNWTSAYGAESSDVIGATASLAANLSIAASGASFWTWAASTTDTRALLQPSSTNRIAATWYGGSYSVDVAFTDTNTHQVALYGVDWDSYARAERVDVIDIVTGQTLDSRSLSNFHNGAYLVWNISGKVRFRLTMTAGSNVVLSGIFVGGPSGTTPTTPAPTATNAASYVSLDTTTEGSWKGLYGADGYNVIANAVFYPSYATVSMTGASWTWAATTTDVRAAQQAGTTTDRIAAANYGSSFTIDVNLTDGNAHQLAFYAVDWDRQNRQQRVDILDAATNTVLDTRTLASFANGSYLIYSLKGHVKIQVTCTGGPNAVLSGLFLR